jgi:hypothetical protein
MVDAKTGELSKVFVAAIPAVAVASVHSAFSHRLLHFDYTPLALLTCYAFSKWASVLVDNVAA